MCQVAAALHLGGDLFITEGQPCLERMMFNVPSQPGPQLLTDLSGHPCDPEPRWQIVL